MIENLSQNSDSQAISPVQTQMPVEIKLLGQRVVLKSSELDPETVQQVVKLVSTKLTEAENRSKGAAPHQIALLALLDLAEEYLQAKARTQDFKTRVDEKTNQLLGFLETEFK